MQMKININGRELSEPQAMTVRVAIEAFASDLAEPNHLGDDAHAKSMTTEYLARIDEIRDLIFGDN